MKREPQGLGMAIYINMFPKLIPELIQRRGHKNTPVGHNDPMNQSEPPFPFEGAD